MASPAAVQRSSLSNSSPLQRLSTFKNPTTTPSAVAAAPPSPLSASSITDPIFSPFLSPSFSSTSFFSAALSSCSPASTVVHLHNAIRLLKHQLRSEVLSLHDDLLSQLSSLHHADHALSTLRSAVSSLQSSLRRVRSELSNPHRSIKSKTPGLWPFLN